MSLRYNNNIKRQKPKENQVGRVKIYVFFQKIQQRVLCPGESAAIVTHLSMRIHPKSCRTLPLKVATTLLSD